MSQITISKLQKLRTMDIEQKILKKIFTIEKEVMHCVAYHNKNLIDVARRFKAHNVDEKVQQVIYDSMSMRYKMSLKLMDDLKQFTNLCDVSSDKKWQEITIMG